MTNQSDTTDYSKHTDEELREGIEKSAQNIARIENEGSDEQLEAARDQHQAMQDELDRRNSG
ncbi:MAG TPA: hypothetical protein VM307_10955 [Egibacteraceae bacterium]|nr:hypothetical protein [Egibacteraceae bacterium]